ncbi:MAG: SRPBCC family protein [Verrucomicrobiales bacterium]|nr:SRPBCC family protein [Verrucomicrobiales bacterium]
MLKKILAALGLLLVVFIIIVALQPSDFRIVRSAQVSAPPERVFPLVNDFHQWQSWSPWAKLDPAAKNSFEGPSSGVGAIFRWSGNNEVGEGSMTITESKPSERILLRLDFLKPMAGTSLTEFTFQPQGDKTVVTWAMTGQNNFVAKAMCLVMNMDKMVGGQFEKGLETMKALAEAPAK